MKIYRLFLVVVAPALAGVSLAAVLEPAEVAVSTVETRVISESPASMELDFRLNSLERNELTIDGERFDLFRFDNEPVAGVDGATLLPSVSRYVIIPPTCGVDLKINTVSTSTLTGVNPYPYYDPVGEAGEAIMQVPGSGGNRLIRADIARNSDGFLPAEPLVIGKPAIMRGYRILPVVFYPLRWNPATQELIVTEAMDVTLDFTSGNNMENVISNPERQRPSRFMGRIIDELVMNPPERDPVAESGSVVYVIGAAQGWDVIADELAPLLEWRRRQGWQTVLLRLGDLSTGGVRAALMNAYNEWEIPPEIIVLCGDSYEGAANISCYDKRAGAGYMYESDHDFTMLDGNDLLPDAVIGRLPIDHPSILRAIVSKTIQYESAPFIGEGRQIGWQKRAALVASNAENGMSSIDVLRWTNSILSTNGYEAVNTLYWTPNNPNPPGRNFINENINNGLSLFVFRGTGGGYLAWDYSRADASSQRNLGMLPFVILAACNTGDYGQGLWDTYTYTERFLNNSGGGAIGAVGAAGGVHTAYSNLYATGVIDGLFNAGMTLQGYAHLAGKMALYRNYNGLDQFQSPYNPQMLAWLTAFYIYNLMGDPATQLFTDTPRRLIVERPQVVCRGDTHIEARVLYDVEDGDDIPAAGVDVCLYRANTVNPHRYQLIKKSDADGRVVFDITPDWTMGEGIVKLTATGYNLMPVLVNWNLMQAEIIGVGRCLVNDDNEGASRGDGDGVANPAETLELTVNIVNRGRERPEGEMTATLMSDDPNLEVLASWDNFDAAPAPGDSVTARNFVVRIGGGFPDGGVAGFQLLIQCGENEWLSSVALPVVAPKLARPTIFWHGNNLEPGGFADMYVTLRNDGHKGAPEINATLFSLTRTVSVTVPRGQFGAIARGDTGSSFDPFSLAASAIHLGGQRADLGLALEAANGLIDTVLFSITVDTARAGSPFGPDDYGYVCTDNTDLEWLTCPEYDWVEIDPRLGGPGENTGLTDTGAQQDQSVVVGLPFVFSYYGEEFNRVTICTNGWLAPGDHRFLVSARNRRIPGPENPPGIIAPFWSDLLVIQNEAGVFTWFDEENARFVIEWSGVRRLLEQGAGEQSRFQVILHDPRSYPSLSGDGDIIFQYAAVDIGGQGGYRWDTPYATVGIASPDLRAGLEYCYWDRYADGAAPLGARRAIRFSTFHIFQTCSVMGRVTDLATGEALEGVQIYTNYGFSAISDANGEYSMDGIAADLVYTFTASKRFYNDSVVTGVEIAEDEAVEINFALRHPEFRLAEDELRVVVGIDTVIERRLEMSNPGNGPLMFDSRFHYVPDGISPACGVRRDDPDAMWEPLLIFTPGDTVQDNVIQSIALAGNMWYIAGGANRSDTLNWFYRFDKHGRYIDRIRQPFDGQYGTRDMEYYDGYLYCATLTPRVYKLNPATGEIVQSWTVPVRNFSPRNITIDPATGRMYLSATVGDMHIFRFDENDSLRLVRTFPKVDPRDNVGIRENGLGWFRDDEDGFNLYLISNAEPEVNPDKADVSVYKMNVNTGEIRFLSDLHPALPASATGRGGMTITSKWNNLVWVMAAVFDDSRGDKAGIFELAPNSSWLSYEPQSGSLEGGESVPLEFTFDAADLDTGRYGVMIEFRHNAEPGFSLLPVELRVAYLEDQIQGDDIRYPAGHALWQNSPNPFNSTTRLIFDIRQPGHVRLTVWDISGREVATLTDAFLTAGRYECVWDAAGLPGGIYFARLQAGNSSFTRKMVILK